MLFTFEFVFYIVHIDQENKDTVFKIVYFIWLYIVSTPNG